MNKQHHKILTTLFTLVIMAGCAVNTAQTSESKEKEAEEVALFSQAKISLIDAIIAAEKKVGGKAIEAELGDESNSVQFEIEILKDGKTHEVIVDGITGKVLVALFSQAKIPLIDAIKAAEKKVGGKAIEAELVDESNSVQFEIEILKDGKTHEVIVDGITGKVLKVSR